MRLRRILATVLGTLALVVCGTLAVALVVQATPAPTAPSSGVHHKHPSATPERIAHAPTAPQAHGTGHDRRPLLSVVGASVAAGVGAGQRSQAWPEQLARRLHWRLAVSADPGAGYVNHGAGSRGPFGRLLTRLRLPQQHPRMLLIQGGHNDLGRPLPAVRRNVRHLVHTIHRQSPRTRLGVMSVFSTGHHPSPAALATDRAIVTAARQADPNILVFDPLAPQWHFPRLRDKLHPTPAGHRWIAHRVVTALHQNGVRPR